MAETYCTLTTDEIKELCREEVWRDISGWEGLYQVSSWGRVKSLARIVPMCDGRQYRVSEKMLKPTKAVDYYQVCLCLSGKEELRTVQRVVLEGFVGLRPDGLEACHNDRDPANNRLDNLRWDTHTGNLADRLAHGTSLIGKKKNNYKLRGRIEEVRNMYLSGQYSVSEIAAHFNVTLASIFYHIRRLGIQKTKKIK